MSEVHYINCGCETKVRFGIAGAITARPNLLCTRRYPTLDEDAKPVEIMQESGDLVILPGNVAQAAYHAVSTITLS